MSDRLALLILAGVFLTIAAILIAWLVGVIRDYRREERRR